MSFNSLSDVNLLFFLFILITYTCYTNLCTRCQKKPLSSMHWVLLWLRMRIFHTNAKAFTIRLTSSDFASLALSLSLSTSDERTRRWRCLVRTTNLRLWLSFFRLLSDFSNHFTWTDAHKSRTWTQHDKKLENSVSDYSLSRSPFAFVFILRCSLGFIPFFPRNLFSPRNEELKANVVIWVQIIGLYSSTRPCWARLQKQCTT